MGAAHHTKTDKVAAAAGGVEVAAAGGAGALRKAKPRTAAQHTTRLLILPRNPVFRRVRAHPGSSEVE
jgi:hypothetical protein